jgi:tetratricopeptide (TPR) repeat protein
MTTRATSLVLVLLAGLAAANSFAAVDPADAAVRFLEQRVKSDPMDSVAQNRLSWACLLQMRKTGDLGFLDRGAQAARASLSAVPAAQNPGGLSALAMAQFESHHFREALALARQARAIDPVNKGALATMGDSALELGNYAEASGIYDTLKEGEPVPSVQARLSRLAEIKGDNQTAIALLQEAVMAEDTEWYHIRLGEIFFRTGQFEKAEREYEAAQKLAPEHFLVLEHFAELRAAQGRYDSAIQLYRQVVTRVPRPDYFQALGDVYLYMGKPAEAKPWYDKALAGYLKSVEAGNAHYFHHLAGFYSDSMENPTEAIRWARKDLEMRHSVYAHDSLAWAYYKDGDFTSAIGEIKQALSMGTQDAHLLFHAAMIFSRAGQLDRGDELLKQAMSVDPKYNSFHVHR